MRQYALQALGWSARRAADFARLAASFEHLPRLGEAVARGELGYTKAREVIKVASPETQGEWLRAAVGSSRRELEAKVKRVRRKAQRQRSAQPDQAEMLPLGEADDPAETTLAEAAPSPVSLRLTAEQRARYDALWRSLGAAPNAEDLLEALAALVEERRTAGAPDRTAATIAPRVRREVLARDRHRCRAPGCAHRRFLEIHHVVPRAHGGTNDPANLVTLCSACHRLWHQRGRPGWFVGHSVGRPATADSESILAAPFSPPTNP